MDTLFIVSTPIGNLEDITIRAIKMLFSVDVIACEDTRRTGLLLDELKKRYPIIYSSSEESSTSREVNQGSSRLRSNDKKPLLVSYYDQTEQSKTPELIALLEHGQSVALVSDAGTPLINDPGYTLVHEALKRNIKVESVPGASAVLTALTSSGLPTDKFLFLGYPPEKSSHRKKLFEDLRHFPASPAGRPVAVKGSALHGCTYIFYCAPHKLEQTLTDMKEILGDIEIVIARELTKVHEKIWKGILSEASKRNFQGEIVLLFTLSSF